MITELMICGTHDVEIVMAEVMIDELMLAGCQHVVSQVIRLGYFFYIYMSTYYIYIIVKQILWQSGFCVDLFVLKCGGRLAFCDVLFCLSDV